MLTNIIFGHLSWIIETVHITNEYVSDANIIKGNSTIGESTKRH